MTQESHQMGLGTRENDPPVTYDTGDTGMTSPAQLEWDGNAHGPTCSPTGISPLPTPRHAQGQCLFWHCSERPQPQKLQDDTGILPSSHTCKKLNNEAQLERQSWGE